MSGGVAVHAEGLSLRGGHGWVYRDVGLDAGPGTLTAVAGQAGSGRTGLLLTLAGRMRPTAGVLTVAGHARPGAVRRVAALGPVEGVNDLDRALTVREHVRERARGLFWNTAASRRAAAALERAGLDLSPDDRTLIRDLDHERRMRLGIALALLDGPGLLVVDNLDAGLTADRRAALWTTLEELAGQGLTVIASCTESPLARTLQLTPREPGDPGCPADPDGSQDLGGLATLGLLEPEDSQEPEKRGEPEDSPDPRQAGAASDPGDDDEARGDERAEPGEPTGDGGGQAVPGEPEDDSEEDAASTGRADESLEEDR
ncbi:ATP-binding cassette domain-containing protein [Planobispora takensis]|uniref:ABC transporter domain-containing protein n=1 Tax=Planobispora takensis TaxID=1367882 RepID=A0A8J3SXL5_9ACTN|nr:ATP-binding cassette domain-containing protein [Planobispora takensis]GII01047.1 hypothetical protein Pta02_30550 [Planobispora takensis]